MEQTHVCSMSWIFMAAPVAKEVNTCMCLVLTASTVHRSASGRDEHAPCLECTSTENRPWSRRTLAIALESEAARVRRQT